MFDYSNIDHSGLSVDAPQIPYDAMPLKNKGYVLKYDLNVDNPVLKQVLGECDRCNADYQIKNVGNNKVHIWIKG